MKIGRVVPEICSRTNKHTYRQTDTVITILRRPTGGKVKSLQTPSLLIIVIFSEKKLEIHAAYHRYVAYNITGLFTNSFIRQLMHSYCSVAAIHQSVPCQMTLLRSLHPSCRSGWASEHAQDVGQHYRAEYRNNTQSSLSEMHVNYKFPQLK